MTSLRRLLVFVTLGLTVLAANVSAQDAKILRILGNAANVTVTRPGQGTVPATMNMPIAQNDTITTLSGVEVYVQTYPGAVATIKANTTVVMEQLGTNQASLDLRQGDLVSQIDPRRNSNYQVRTPRGVAAARGTAFVVTIRGTNYAVSSFADGVTVTPLVGGQPQQPIAVGTGSATVNNQPAIPLSQAGNQLPANITIGDIASAAMAAVAVVKDTNALGDATASQNILNQAAAAVAATGDNTVIAQATAAAAAAAPNQAGAVVTATIQGAGTNAANVATTVTQAAAQGVGQAAAQSAASQTTNSTTAANTAATQTQEIVAAATTALAGAGVTLSQDARVQLAGVAANGATAGLTSTAVSGNPLAGSATNVAAQIRNSAAAGAGVPPGQLTSSGATPPPGRVGRQDQTPVTPIDPSITVSPAGGNP